MRISFIILNYNRSQYLERAVRSCLNQYIFGFDRELIVVDDNSSDNSLELLKKYGNNVLVIRNSENMGVGYGSNVGLEACTGDFFIRVDSDDFLSPIASAVLFTALQSNPQHSFAFADHYRVDENENKIALVNLQDLNLLIRHGAGILFNTVAIKSVGGYNSLLRNAEDAELILKLIKSGHTGIHIPIPLYRYYIHGDNLSDSNEQLRLIESLKTNYGF